MNSRTAVDRVISVLMAGDARRATLFISPREVVSACRRHRRNRRDRSEDFVLKVGAPNYAERAFIVSCRKAGEPFPLKKVQVKFYPAKKWAAKK